MLFFYSIPGRMTHQFYSTCGSTSLPVMSSLRCHGLKIFALGLLLTNQLALWCGPWSRAPTVRRTALSSENELVSLRKRELLEILQSYDVPTTGLTKQELIEAIHRYRAGSKPVEKSEELEMSQREIAELAMDDWQNASTVGFDCKSGRRAEDGVDFDIIGPDGHLQHTVSFRHSWPPKCTCAPARSWGETKRCKHVCLSGFWMILM